MADDSRIDEDTGVGYLTTDGENPIDRVACNRLPAEQLLISDRPWPAR